MPQKIVLPDVSFTGAGLPVIRDDSLLSAGSLFLFDPAHSLGGFTGVPAASAKVPNVAWQPAATLLGSGTADTLAGVVNTTGMPAASTTFQVERTAKGGVHGMSTQGGRQTAAAAWTVQLPAALRDYIYAHRADHSFYVSLWHILTRTATAGNTASQSPFHYTNTASATVNNLFTMGHGTFSPTAVPPSLGSKRDPVSDDFGSTLGAARFCSGGVNGIYGTGPAATNPVELGVGAFSAWASLNYNKAPSRILYRAYVEDLTVSGRSYAAVEALDYALFVKEMRTAGGKYYGDTYSTPSVLVP